MLLRPKLATSGSPPSVNHVDTDCRQRCHLPPSVNHVDTNCHRRCHLPPSVNHVDTNCHHRCHFRVGTSLHGSLLRDARFCFDFPLTPLLVCLSFHAVVVRIPVRTTPPRRAKE